MKEFIEVNNIETVERMAKELGGKVDYVTVPPAQSPDDSGQYKYIDFKYKFGLIQRNDSRIARYLPVTDNRYRWLIDSNPAVSFTNLEHLRKISTNNSDQRERRLPEGVFSVEWSDSQKYAYKNFQSIKSEGIVVYSSSWNLYSGDDFILWDRYADRGTGICLITTPARLASAMNVSCVHGQISYIPEGFYENMVGIGTAPVSLPLFSVSDEEVGDSFEHMLTYAYRPSEYIKSNCFSSEHEYRVCVYVFGKSEEYPNYLKCGVDGVPFESIRLGPNCRISDTEIEKLNLLCASGVTDARS